MDAVEPAEEARRILARGADRLEPDTKGRDEAARALLKELSAVLEGAGIGNVADKDGFVCGVRWNLVSVRTALRVVFANDRFVVQEWVTPPGKSEEAPLAYDAGAKPDGGAWVPDAERNATGATSAVGVLAALMVKVAS
jgi:hypothetical protein